MCIIGKFSMYMLQLKLNLYYLLRGIEYVPVCFSRVQLFVTLWTVAPQATLSMEFSRQEYWRGLPCPPPGGLPDPETELATLMSLALAGGFFTTSATWEALRGINYQQIHQTSCFFSFLKQFLQCELFYESIMLLSFCQLLIQLTVKTLVHTSQL